MRLFNLIAQFEFGHKKPSWTLSYLTNSSQKVHRRQTLTHYSLVLLFYTPWTFRFSDVFRGYGKATPGCNGLMKESFFLPSLWNLKRLCWSSRKVFKKVFEVQQRCRKTCAVVFSSYEPFYLSPSGDTSEFERINYPWNHLKPVDVLMISGRSIKINNCSKYG